MLASLTAPRDVLLSHGCAQVTLYLLPAGSWSESVECNHVGACTAIARAHCVLGPRDLISSLVSLHFPAVSFLFRCLPVIANVFLGVPLPLSPFLMIVICILTDLWPSLSLVSEQPEDNISQAHEETPQEGEKGTRRDERGTIARCSADVPFSHLLVLSPLPPLQWVASLATFTATIWSTLV